MSKIIGITFIIMIVLTSPAFSFRVSEEKEPIEGYTKLEMMDVDKITGSKMEGCVARIKGLRVIYDDGKISYLLCVKVYLKGHPAFGISEVIFLIDNVRTILKGNDYQLTKSDIALNDKMMEEIYCDVDTKLLEQLAEGKDVQFKIKGTYEYVAGKFPQGLQKQFGEFCKICGI